ASPIATFMLGAAKTLRRVRKGSQKRTFKSAQLALRMSRSAKRSAKRRKKTAQSRSYGARCMGENTHGLLLEFHYPVSELHID
ncbi:MAG: hypothetical protein KAI82_13645, partial [Tritonibacter mobilis]|nr:hypothetical protein [Tritonibacter mobilis]